MLLYLEIVRVLTKVACISLPSRIASITYLYNKKYKDNQVQENKLQNRTHLDIM